MNAGEVYPHRALPLQSEGVLLYGFNVARLTAEDLQSLAQQAAVLAGEQAVQSAVLCNLMSVEPLKEDEPPVPATKQDLLDFAVEHGYPYPEHQGRDGWRLIVHTEGADRFYPKGYPSLRFIGFTPDEHHIVSPDRNGLTVDLVTVHRRLAITQLQPDAWWPGHTTVQDTNFLGHLAYEKVEKTRPIAGAYKAIILTRPEATEG
jgi:hypothetical protein